MKTSTNINKIFSKILNSNRITKSECVKLLNLKRVEEIFYLANNVREKKYGNNTTFSINKHINYTNVCENRCLFCAFYRDEKSSEVKRFFPNDLKKILEEVKNLKNIEIHITGGLDPKFTFEKALEVIKTIKQIKKDAIIKAFTMVEIDFFAKTSGLKEIKVMERLKEAGVSSFPGGGAEIFSKKIRNKICPQKINSERWLALSKMAHIIGIPTNATMLYGIGESSEQIADHLFRLRSLQDETHGFMSFIPLLFQSEKTPLKHLKKVSLLEQLKIYSVSRIFLDNIPHIKNHWAMAGLKCAELSQWCGVDDLEGTVFEERIAHEGGATTPIGMTREQVKKIIKDAGRIAVERDGLYNIV